MKVFSGHRASSPYQPPPQRQRGQGLQPPPTPHRPPPHQQPSRQQGRRLQPPPALLRRLAPPPAKEELEPGTVFPAKPSSFLHAQASIFIFFLPNSRGQKAEGIYLGLPQGLVGAPDLMTVSQLSKSGGRHPYLRHK
jgi:hypothetical protein